MDKSLARREPAPVVEAEIVIRNPRITRWRFLAYAALSAGFLVAYILLHRHFGDQPEARWLEAPAAAFYIVVVALNLLIDEVIYPAWIRIGADGIAIGKAFEVTRYPWKKIRWFALDGRHASLVPEQATGLWEDPGAIRLPDLNAWSPEDLVALLEEKRKLFTSPRISGR
jgi:hypothetical protein